MESFDISMKDLLMNRGYLFQIPNYQRSYVWQKDEITAYLKDISYCYEQNSEKQVYDHFFGQMVFREANEDKANRKIFEVVDGQQRLTTITLTVAAIYRLILVNEEKIDTRVKKCLEELKKQYIVSCPDQGTVKRLLTLSNRDNMILTSIATVQEEKLERSFDFHCTNESQKRILNAYYQIFEYLDTYFNNVNVDSYSEMLLSFIETVLKNFSIVLIKPKSIGYSYALYQIVNDRGVLLTSAELLKARTMELLFTNENLFKECEKIWDNILNDPGKETTKYLIWHYTAIMHQVPSKSKLHEIYEKKIFNCYGKHDISESEQKILASKIQQLYTSVKWCRELSKGYIPIDIVHPQIQDMFFALICGLKNEIAIPLYINMLSLDNDSIKKKIIPFVTVLISKFFFSAKTIANIHGGSLSKLYNILSGLICSDPNNFDEMKKLFKEEQTKKTIGSIFSQRMENSIYSKNSTTISKYLLYLLELFDESDDISHKGIISRDESMTVMFEKISTEHIASRTGADGNTFTENERDSLGNLTILGKTKNNDLDAKPFALKCKTYARSPFSLTRAVAQNQKWEKAEYIARQNNLKSKAVEIFIL